MPPRGWPGSPVVAVAFPHCCPLLGLAQRQWRRQDPDEGLRPQPLAVFGKGLLRVLGDAPVGDAGGHADFVAHIGYCQLTQIYAIC